MMKMMLMMQQELLVGVSVYSQWAVVLTNALDTEADLVTQHALHCFAIISGE